MDGKIGIQTLPGEILAMVFQHLDDIFSVVTLGLTCKLLFSAGYACLVDHLKSHYYSQAWFGDRIICVGDDARITDLPQDAFTEVEGTAMKLAFESLRGESNEDDSNEQDHSQTLQAYLVEKASSNNSNPIYTLLSSYDDVLFDTGFWKQARESNLISRPFVEQTRLLELLYVGHMHDIVLDEIPSQGLVLYNITTGEYVRGDAFPLLYDGAPSKRRAELELMYETPGPRSRAFYRRKLGFAEIVAARFCWTYEEHADATSGHAYTNLHRGRWAGHRFEIATSDCRPRLKGTREWKDVSEEVMADMKRIWIEEFGDEWQQHL
ncbi:hypothetical protein BXZ70DRAFT_98821 [Cristinia sonorae]|uniref:F-box domain-containing protein n=1 Tax=Cristinia sonorae TaxID=1940300 RepID=A0A8K0UR42_9AGAR|nr:hypothetical protein BXZ70DRAFT_98821 [Cristinia sonorae]